MSYALRSLCVFPCAKRLQISSSSCPEVANVKVAVLKLHMFRNLGSAQGAQSFWTLPR